MQLSVDIPKSEKGVREMERYDWIIVSCSQVDHLVRFPIPLYYFAFWLSLCFLETCGGPSPILRTPATGVDRSPLHPKATLNFYYDCDVRQNMLHLSPTMLMQKMSLCAG